jgi:hypothetical protein
LNLIKNYKYYLIYSFIGVFYIFFILFFSSHGKTNEIERIIITFIFSLCCLFGITLVFYPGWYKKIMIDQSDGKKEKKSCNKRVLVGHHPDCNYFKKHVIKFKRLYCAGCFGLLVGCIISIIFFIIYIFINIIFNPILYKIFIILGITIIFFTYFEILIIKRKIIVHILLNIFFIISFFFITIGVMELTGNIIYSFLTIIICFIWLETRVIISKYNHMKICENCNNRCKTFS